jgi:hypothetical protein
LAWLLEKEVRQELPKEWGGIVPTEVFMTESQEIVRRAGEEGIILRILGGLGIAVHCMEHREFAKKLGRIGTGTVEGQEYSDIDLIAYRSQRGKVKEFFAKISYVRRKATLSTAASERQVYYHPKGWFFVDVFFDKLLVANHPINFKGRLELDCPTITVADMLLEKIQMWEAFSAKDLKDCLLLLKAHDVKDKSEKECINASYLAKLFAQDWGFWYTATTNLRRIAAFMSEIGKLGPEIDIKPEQIESKDIEEITAKIEAILNRIDKEPKPFSWRMRAKVGTRKRWYNHVELPETVGGFGIWEAILRNNKSPHESEGK